jgi:opacity protein-like surface antigen
MIKPSTLLLSLVLAAATASAAHAAVCVQLDTSHDNLTPQERSGAMTMFASTLQQNGQQVVATGCEATYVVYHVRLGVSVNVFVQGPQGYRQATARAIEELPAVYSQMIRSLLTGLPMNTYNGTVDRTNVTAAQEAPNRVEADSLWYVRLGYATIPSTIVNSGPTFGFGYRYELDSVGIDFSFLNLMVASDRSDGGATSSAGLSGSWLKLMGLYFFNPTASSSSYVGGGISWGGAIVADSTREFSGSGLEADVSVGFEFLRASTIRLFAQADATLPLYSSTTDVLTPGGATTSDSAWLPTFAVSLGVGWGRSITRVHVVQ